MPVSNKLPIECLAGVYRVSEVTGLSNDFKRTVTNGGSVGEVLVVSCIRCDNIGFGFAPFVCVLSSV